MPVSPSFLPTLKTIADQSASTGFAFANKNAPAIRALVKQAALELSEATLDPTDANKCAVRLTATGYAEIGAQAPTVETVTSADVGQMPAALLAPPAPEPAAPVQPAQPAAAWQAPPSGLTPIPPGTPFTQAPAGQTGQQAAKVKTSRGPNTVPTIGVAGPRMMALPANVTSGRGGTRNELYPFKALGAPDQSGYDSFFIPNTDAMPNAYKVVKSAVGSANKRYAPKGIEFTTRAIAADHANVNPTTGIGLAGCRVFRVK